MKKDRFVAIVGICVALLIVGAFIAYYNTRGTLRLLLTDAPVNVHSLDVTISNVSIAGESWIHIPFVNGTETVTVNLVALENVTTQLALTSLPVGNYTKIRFEVTNASVSFLDSTLPVPVTVPPGTIDVIVHFEIKPAATTTLLLDMNVDWIAISQQHNLRPVMKASVVG